MRAASWIPLLFLAACGGGGENQQEAAEGPPPANFPAGQWELSTEVATLQAPDALKARLGAADGSRAGESVCVGSGRPPRAFFAGENYDCRTAEAGYYVRNGRINVTLHCRHEAFDGTLTTIVSGRFGTDTVEFERELSSNPPNLGAVAITTRVTGRRTGDCAPAGEDANQSGDRAG